MGDDHVEVIMRAGGGQRQFTKHLSVVSASDARHRVALVQDLATLEQSQDSDSIVMNSISYLNPRDKALIANGRYLVE